MVLCLLDLVPRVAQNMLATVGTVGYSCGITTVPTSLGSASIAGR